MSQWAVVLKNESSLMPFQIPKHGITSYVCNVALPWTFCDFIYRAQKRASFSC